MSEACRYEIEYFEDGRVKRTSSDNRPLDFVYCIGKLSLGPRDLVVVKTDLQLDKEQAQYLRDNVDRQMKAAGFDNKVLIFSHGVELQILEAEDA